MSALGQKRKWQALNPMSALTHEADIRWCQSHVGFVPQADIAAFGIAQLEIRSIGSYETLIQAVLNSSERGL